MPCGVVIHDVGDWGDPANRLIRLKGVVAHYLWQKVKGNEKIDREFISRLSSKITQEFLDVPALDQVTSDVEAFVQNLRKIKVIN